MKIDNITAPHPLHRPEKSRPAVAGPDQTTGPHNDAFVVTLSADGEEAIRARDEELRRAKVAAIRDQLAAGSYNISGKDVAGKILEALKG